MNTRHLTCFLAIYDERTISAAAEKLRLSVSALSHHLSNLEQDLGVQLFTRQRRGMEPTADGERFRAHAHAILAAMKAAEKDMRANRDRVTGSVSISMATSVIRVVGFDLVDRISRDHPDLNLTVNESLSSTVLGDIASGRADLGVAFNPQASDQLRVTPVLTEDMVLVGQPALVGDTEDPIPFDEVLTNRLILLAQGLSAQALTRNKRLLKRLEDRATLQVNSVQTMNTCLLAGLGVTVGTYQIFSEGIAKGALQARPIVAPRLDREMCLVEPRNRIPSYAVEHTRNLLMDLIRNSVRDGRWRADLTAVG
ncbi:LysR family transcriptional regulator [Ovoidimarina sediminis]|uniref:LysR family transcriptional regulator n=1 Tax=Ovoidimarina sediminis TaxID=3079856 RepID=UPI0029097446|nr:LysR family transcriptional regulator [Rhodophyticola sp. MJ-SS7]MDU8943655.1 LysR family transcriptional regulator [Rhodophyticola sp. MJ-SS7]